MKVFIWADVYECSSNHHSEGGVVVFAETEERARTIANNVSGCNILETELPDEVRDVFGGEEAVYIMPNAGCC